MKISFRECDVFSPALNSWVGSRVLESFLDVEVVDLCNSVGVSAGVYRGNMSSYYCLVS